MPKGDKLTLKQRRFVGEYLKTGNATKAAYKAYDTSYGVAQRIGAENLSKPVIQESIEESLRSQNLTLDKTAENLAWVANSRPEKITTEAMLKANIEVLKLLRAYPDKKSIRTSISLSGTIKDMSYSDAKKSLEALNNSLAGLDDDTTEGSTGTTSPIIEVVNEPDVA